MGYHVVIAWQSINTTFMAIMWKSSKGDFGFLCCSVPILLLSETIQTWFNFKLEVPFQQGVSIFLSLCLYLYGGYPFVKGMLNEVKSRQPGMMTLVGMAISVAFAYSAVSISLSGGTDFLWELATLVDVMLLGHWVEAKSVLGASRALEELVKLMPATAHLFRGEEVLDIPTSQLNPGDLVLIRPGERIPSDGVVVEGDSYVNEALLSAFEGIRDIKVVVFDKTGTLTEGDFGVTDVVSFVPIDELVSLTSSVELNSEHIIAKAIVKYAKAKGTYIIKSDEFKSIPGRYVYGKVGGKTVYVGGPSLLNEMKIVSSDRRITELQEQGKKVIFIIAEGKLIGAFALSDKIRDESRKAVKRLKEMGIVVYMITGDSEEVARWVAKELEVDNYFAQVLPGEKAEKVSALKREWVTR